MNKLTYITAIMLGVVATIGAAGVANANMLTITPGTQEAIGDPGGTNYANGPTAAASAGAGIPTALGGWSGSANFAPDLSFGGALGITGYDGAYLGLAQAGAVTFQFMGKGDAGNHDIFQVNTGSGWTTIWDNQLATNGTCGVTGTSPNCLYTLSQQTLNFGAGLLGFRYEDLTTGQISTNDGANGNIHDNPVGPGYFLGVDPYLATGQYQTNGSAVYAGFSDMPAILANGAPGDHDYEDLVVRISAVPEPASMALLGLGLLAMAGRRRRKS